MIGERGLWSIQETGQTYKWCTCEYHEFNWNVKCSATLDTCLIGPYLCTQWATVDHELAVAVLPRNDGDEGRIEETAGSAEHRRREGAAGQGITFRHGGCRRPGGFSQSRQ